MSGNLKLQSILGEDEKILWQGKPKFGCYILESFFLKAFIGNTIGLAYILLFYSIFIKTGVFRISTERFLTIGNIVFISFGAQWLWTDFVFLMGVVLFIFRYRNIGYIITEKGIYISGGLFSRTYEMKSFMEMSNIDIHKGFFDHLFRVGDVVVTCNFETMNASGTYGMSELFHQNNIHYSRRRSFAICDVSDYRDVFYLLKILQTDVYSDVLFPNDLRSEENGGYRP